MVPRAWLPSSHLMGYMEATESLEYRFLTTRDTSPSRAVLEVFKLSPSDGCPATANCLARRKPCNPDACPPLRRFRTASSHTGQTGAPHRSDRSDTAAILSQESVHTTLSITHQTRKRPSTGPRTTHGRQLSARCGQSSPTPKPRSQPFLPIHGSPKRLELLRKDLGEKWSVPRGCYAPKLESSNELNRSESNRHWTQPKT
jgi:hypothetical protein